MKKLMLPAAFAALVIAVLVPVGALGYRFELWDLGTAFGLLRWFGRSEALAGAGLVHLAIPLALIALFLAWRSRAQASAGIAIAALLANAASLYTVISIRSLAQEVPPIHDISTDLTDIPQFVAVAALRKPGDHPTEHAGSYAELDVAALQREAYPNLQTLSIPRAAAFEQALASARDMGWAIVAQSEEQGRIEATATTFWFGFKDDIVIRLRPAGANMAVDLRSQSRVGRSDLGANAKRIRQYLQQLQAATAS